MEGKEIVGVVVENSRVTVKKNGKAVAKNHNSSSNNSNKREKSLKLFPRRTKRVRQELLYHKCQRLNYM